MLGRQALGALADRRPAVDRAALAAVVEDVIGAKAASLASEERPHFQETRRRWAAGGER